MSNVLRIDWIQIKDGHEWQEPYYLTGRLVGVIGPIDRGKSSMVDCIDFLFGRSVNFKGAVDEQLRSVRAQIQIGEGGYVLRRNRHRPGRVSVKDAVGDEQGPFPLKSGEGEQNLSDWLLAQLDLDDVFASVRLPGGNSLDFVNDLVPYLHIRQEDIDRFVIRPNGSREDAARIAVLKILLFLSSAELERLAAQMHDIRNEIDRRKQKAREIDDFLNASQDTNADSLGEEIARLHEDETQAKHRLESLKEQADAATRFDRELREKLEEARQRLNATEEDELRARQREHEANHKLYTVDQSLSALADVENATAKQREHLALLYPACPACDAYLGDRVVPTGRCSLCTEPLSGTAQTLEKARLQQDREQFAHALTQAEAALANAREITKSARDDFENKRKAIDECTFTEVTPYVDAIATATAELEVIRSRIATLERLRGPQRRLAERYEEIKVLQDKYEECEAQKNELIGRLNDPGEVLERINGLFRTIVHAFQLPWATGRARLDSKTLLPMVDEQDFAQRGGGSRTAVSVAYSLALLMYALEYPALFRLPPFLILDSPQKNIGRNDYDRELANRIYGWISDYFEDRRQILGGRYETFQLIIVDNDIPTESRNRFNTIIKFGEDDGFVRKLAYPHGRPEQMRIDDEIED